MRTILQAQRTDYEVSTARFSQKKSQRYPENYDFGPYQPPLSLSVRSADNPEASELRAGKSAGNRGDARIIEP
ncbi:MAG: hypothetical protein WA765_14350 [Candidatus Acidiferrum sp.]